MGDRDNTNEIRYLAREHERQLAWVEGKYDIWLFLSMLNYVAGYGIGRHTFRVLYWVLGFSLAGALLLWATVPEAGKEYKKKDGSLDSGRRFVWCFGASLTRLLPLIELKEFQAFFEEPDKAGFKLWQRVAFSFLGIVGWVLGGILLIALSGLTQNA
jgi:hypothetical protein